MGKTSFISHSARSQCLQSQVGSKSMRWVRCLWDHLFQTELNLNLWYENGQKFRPNIDTPCRHRWLCGSPHRRTSTRRTLFLFSVTSPDIFPIYLQIFFETSSQLLRYFSSRLQLYSRHQDQVLREYMAVITAPGLPTKLDNNFVQPCIWRLQPVIKTAPVKVMPIHNRSLGKLSPDTFIKFYENAFLWGFDHDIQFRGLITSLWPGNVCNVWRKHIKEFLSAWFPFEIPHFYRQQLSNLL